MGQCREWGWIVSLDQVAQFQPCDSLLADLESMWFYTLLHGDSLSGSIGEGKGCIDPPVIVWKVCSGVENDLVEVNRTSIQGQFCVILHVDAQDSYGHAPWKEALASVHRRSHCVQQIRTRLWSQHLRMHEDSSRGHHAGPSHSLQVAVCSYFVFPAVRMVIIMALTGEAFWIVRDLFLIEWNGVYSLRAG